MFFEEVINIIKEISDPESAEEWDNSGVQINVGEKKIRKVLIALDITKDIVIEAKDNNVDLIITHHPLIFDHLRKVDSNVIIGNYIVELIKAEISVYAAHTDFDKAAGGNNDYIASILKLTNVKKFDGNSIGTVGELFVRMSFEEVCSYVKDSLKSKNINAVGSPWATVRKVGICSGAAGSKDMIDKAVDLGCELYITGDVKYHDAQYAAEKGICLIDAGHYGTEKFFIENFTAKLKEKTGDSLEIIPSTLNLDPFKSM